MKKTELFEKMETAKGKKEVVELVKQYFSELGVNKEGDGRKAQVLECLEVGMTTKEIAEKIVAKGGTSWGAVILGFAVYSAIVVFGIFGVTKIFA